LGSAGKDDIASHYRRLSDYDIAALHAQGPTAFASPEIWHVLEEEFHRRTSDAGAVQEIETEYAREQAALSAVASAAAPIHLRLAQGAADLVVCFAVLLLLIAALAVLGLPSWAVGTLAVALAPLLYPGLFEARNGATPVMRLFQLKVVDEVGGLPSLRQAAFRAYLKAYLFIPFQLGIVISLLRYATGERNPWYHDSLSRTTVVRDERISQPAGV